MQEDQTACLFYGDLELLPWVQDWQYGAKAKVSYTE